MEGIILAAGMSTRFPENKMLQMIEGVTLIEKTVIKMAPYVNRIIVVVGHKSHLIEEILAKYDKVILAYNKDYKEGMYSSIKCGMALAGEDVYLIPGDMAFVSDKTYQKMSEQDGQILIPSYNMKSGHPIKLAYPIVKAICKSKHEHLRAFLNEYDKDYLVVEDPYILVDIDTKKDLEKVRGRIQ
ncbi:nucleotidyltransferase family protein [Acidaminobacter sp. JC074]|uniref:nucleotidyltransferase family protein n=1 Tax=Acidaminobacter sp. JC074 TaxID=2530199 RepID=UPI001F0E87B3|nr:nucleotidyltransferase family protein [Acidaminobacter sp. JC074]MCH4889763.1 nucleotidyltransferase family protein [Acidaminobacter sp. JC074]